MPLSLSETDYQPIERFAFQRWGERRGAPYCDIRPLTTTAAERVWRWALRHVAVSEDDPLPHDLYDRPARLDLATSGDWDESTVRDWLLGHVPRRDAHTLVTYGPQWAVRVPWGTFCDHWLTFCWPGACCAWPESEEWVLRHDPDQFLLSRRRSAAPTGRFLAALTREGGTLADQ